MTLLELCVKLTSSQRKGARLAAFVIWWDLCRKDLGHSPTMEEYIEWSGESSATAYREQKLFREAFAPLQTPDPVLDHMKAHGLGEVVDPGLLAA